MPPKYLKWLKMVKGQQIGHQYTISVQIYIHRVWVFSFNIKYVSGKLLVYFIFMQTEG